MCRFLLVSLNIDAILGEVTIRQRRKKLEEMTLGNGLSDAYTATLTRLKAQKGYKSVLGLKVLMWALYAERPLRAQELCHALGVEIGSTDLDLENVPALRTLLSSCLGLVTVEASSSTVRLVHFTLQEYLLRGPVLFNSPHATIAEVCLTYLNFRSIRDLSLTLHSAPEKTPLLDYASVYWGRHARRGMTKNTKILALRFLDRFDEHISAQLVLRHHRQDFIWIFRLNSIGRPMGFTGLHGAAFHGVPEVVLSVLETKEWSVNANDCTGTTALSWAAQRGHEEVVKMLLEREDINPDQPDIDGGRTALSWAAENGHEGIVKMLLEREDVNPDRDIRFGKAPLSWAAWNGHEGVVKIFLQREGVNPNQEDACFGSTPLSWAATRGHEGVVKMLLEREEVNPNYANTRYGRTALSRAAEQGHEGVVKILLEREDAALNQADIQDGRTPLSWAAEYGHEGVVKILLEREDVNLNQADTGYGRTPLSWGAVYGHEGIVNLLLERKDIRIAALDNNYQTPLSLASSKGHAGVVKMLERHDTNSDT